MVVEINIPWSAISLKVWDRAANSGSAVRHISATRYFNNCAVRPSMLPDILTTAVYASLTGGPGVASTTPVWCHTSVEIDCEINSTVILYPLLIHEGLLSVIRESICTKYWLTNLSQACPGKKCGYNVVNWLPLHHWHDHSCWLGHKHQNNQQLLDPERNF